MIDKFTLLPILSGSYYSLIGPLGLLVRTRSCNGEIVWIKIFMAGRKLENTADDVCMIW